jgi:hypothetical protein
MKLIKIILLSISTLYLAGCAIFVSGELKPTSITSKFYVVKDTVMYNEGNWKMKENIHVIPGGEYTLEYYDDEYAYYHLPKRGIITSFDSRMVKDFKSGNKKSYDDFYLEHIKSYTDGKFAYPGCKVGGVKIPLDVKVLEIALYYYICSEASVIPNDQDGKSNYGAGDFSGYQSVSSGVFDGNLVAGYLANDKYHPEIIQLFRNALTYKDRENIFDQIKSDRLVIKK